jgi:Zn-dependent peptidase ImmA (M78 family)/fido (protein-threonine AMPylation protein)
MLKDMGVRFTVGDYSNLEGLYIPAENATDIAVVGINWNRPISRQRFSAAHELCHHLKDLKTSTGSILCAVNSNSEIERYAEKFAAELLMPRDEVKRQISEYAVNGYVDLKDVLKIAEHFGASFQSCLNRLAWDFQVIRGNTSKDALDYLRKKFKPLKMRKELGFNDVILYEQFFETASDFLTYRMSPHAVQDFKAKYIFHDSRMEDVQISPEKAAEIVVDLRLHGSESQYCKEENQNIIEVAGLSLVYDYIFEKASEKSFKPSIYDTQTINRKLYSTAPFPDFGGSFRQANTLVAGAKVETVDYNHIYEEIMFLDKDLQRLIDSEDSISVTTYIEDVLRIHYKLTTIHAYRDGNGRTIRAFTNLMFARKGLPTVLFEVDSKETYKKALAAIDASRDYSQLFEIYYKALMKSAAMLEGKRLRRR